MGIAACDYDNTLKDLANSPPLVMGFDPLGATGDPITYPKLLQSVVMEPKNRLNEMDFVNVAWEHPASIAEIAAQTDLELSSTRDIMASLLLAPFRTGGFTPLMAEKTLAVCEKLKRNDAAIVILEAWTALQPDVDALWLDLARRYKADKRFDDALVALERAIILSPSIVSLRVKAHVLTDLERFDEALLSLETVIESGADLAPDLALKGHILRRMRKFAEAAVAFKTCSLRAQVGGDLAMFAEHQVLECERSQNNLSSEPISIKH